MCYHHSVFRPTFPIPDMSVSELEHAATASSRWIALSFSKDRNADGVLPIRQSRTTLTIDGEGFGVVVKLTFAGNNQFTHPSTYVFGIIVTLCIVVQMNYFSKALNTFSTNVCV